MSELKKFNRNYLQHAQNRGKLLTELSSFLKWTPDQFVISNTATSTIVDNLDTITFFRNLNEQLMISEPNHDFFWIAFQIINISIQNTTTRRFLIDSMRIIAGVSSFALTVASHDEGKQTQVWMLLENITTGIHITSEEPYLTDLIEHLVTSIKDPQLSNEIKLLQTSTLTNLCFNNEVVVACLLRFTKSKELLHAIYDMRILWCKLGYAIASFDHDTLDFELITIFKYVFNVEYFSGLIRNKNHRILKHLQELLEKCLQRDEHSKNTFQQFDFNETIEGILTIFDSKMNSEEDVDRNENENSEHMNLFLGIVNLILTVSNKSLQSNIYRLFKLAIEEVGTANVSSTAIKTVRLIISNFEMEKSAELITLVSRLLENLDHSDLPVASEVYQLLSTMYTKCRNVNNKLSEDHIHKLIDVQNLCYKLTDDNLSMHIYRIQWLFIYASQNEAFIPEFENLMQNKNVHYILANGLRHSSTDVCTLTMTLIRSNQFPLQAVSKIIANENTLKPTQKHCKCNCNSTIEITRPCFSAALEKRVNVAVDKVMAKVKDDSSVRHYSGISVERKTEHINILEYQNIFASSKIQLLESQLKISSDMITAQSNEIGGLDIIIRHCRNKLSQMELKEEEYVETVEKLKAGYNSLKAKHDNITTQLRDLSKRNDYLKQERTNLKTKLKQRDQDNIDLQTQLTEERKIHSADIAQQKQDHEREKSDLKIQHTKEVDSLSSKLIQESQKQTEELKLQHTKDLEDYSKKHAKLSKLVMSYEQKIVDNKAELENFSTKVDQLKNELAEYVRTNAKYEKDIEEKETELITTMEKLKDSEERLEKITSFLKAK